MIIRRMKKYLAVNIEFLLLQEIVKIKAKVFVSLMKLSWTLLIY